MDYKLYVVLNSDLNMTPGNAAAQVGHIVQIITEQMVSNTFESTPSQYCINYLKWKLKPTIVVLKASGENIHKLKDENDAVYFIDNYPDNTTRLTAVGFYPSNINSGFFSEYKTF